MTLKSPFFPSQLPLLIFHPMNRCSLEMKLKLLIIHQEDIDYLIRSVCLGELKSALTWKDSWLNIKISKQKVEKLLLIFFLSFNVVYKPFNSPKKYENICMLIGVAFSMSHTTYEKCFLEKNYVKTMYCSNWIPDWKS